MDPTLAFVLYLLAFIGLVGAGVIWPLIRRGYTETHLIALSLALVALAWALQAGHAAF